jgi:hypothetical protein
MRDLVVASLRCNELAREPSAGRWVWLVNEVPARCIRSVVWLEKEARRVNLTSDMPAAGSSFSVIVGQVAIRAAGSWPCRGEVFQPTVSVPVVSLFSARINRCGASATARVM